MSLFPAIKQNRFYSIQFDEEYNIMFEDLYMIDLEHLEATIKLTKEEIILVPNTLTINTKNRTITIVGYRINATTWFVTNSGKGNIYLNNYNCSNETILEGIKYIYHILRSQRA